MKRDIEFLFELGALRLIPRQWRRFHLQNTENVAEHHFRVTWLALIIAAREGKGNVEKIMKLAIVHDITESRTGDVDYIARQYVTRNEEQAIEDMLEGTPLHDEFVALWHEYEKRESIESKIVKDADNLSVDMEVVEQGDTGHQLVKHWEQARRHVGTTRLYTKTAKELYKLIWKSNPHDWHLNSPQNRLNGGDWKKLTK